MVEEGDDPLEEIRSEMAFQTERTFDDEEEDERIDTLDEFLNKNSVLQENLMELYEEVAGTGSIYAVVLLFRKCLSVNQHLVNRLMDKGEEDLAEKWGQELVKMRELIDEREINRDLDIGMELAQNVDSEMKGFSTGKLEFYGRKYGTEMESYAFRLLSGTSIASQGTGGGRSRSRRRR